MRARGPRKEGLGEGWQKELAKGWRRVGEGLAGFRTLRLCNSRNARLEERVCDSMETP